MSLFHIETPWRWGSLAAGLSWVFVGSLFAEEVKPDFNRDIRPILSAKCFACHGPDEKSREADLRLDTATGIQADLGGHRAVVPGKPEQSALIERIESADESLRMPPAESGLKLSAEEKETLRKWIVSGAEYQVHWAFQAPQKAQRPKVAHTDWPQQPLDYFVLARLEKAGLTPSEPADRYQLIRRVSLDLIGLPPTPAEADAFINDDSPKAFEKVVDRLLKSPHFGERWARMWLDLARYADTKGYEKDRPREIWRYRDWVIQALNHDMPYDQFTREQLAGDLLPNATTDQQLATAFHRNTMTNDEGGTDNEEFRVAAVKDRVDTTLQVWMGLTMGCAKCHSHKYDPITQRDYYEFYAFFNQTEDADRGDDAPLLPTPTKEQQTKLAELESRLQSLQKSQADEKTVKQAREAIANLKKSFPKTPIMRDLPANKQRTTHIHDRGNFLSPADAVKPAVPNVFGNWPVEAPQNRLGVAEWITQPANPLTARVMANRVWARLFGVGIVETEEDFGAQGLPPSHPQLLDWLAVDFRENGWSLKHLLKTIVMSATYQQSSTVTPERLKHDPNNRLLSRGPRFRLSAELVRDQALSASGLLSEKVGGPSVMPPQPPGVWKSTYSALSWENAQGPDRYRRGLYTYWKRTSPYPSMIAFDAGSGEVCQIRRVRTNTPLQALITLNDPAFLEAAGALAQHMSQTEGDLEKQITHGFRKVLIRPPAEKEHDRLVKLYYSLKTDYESDPEAAKALLQTAGQTTGDAALVAVANVLLNLDETLMKP